MIVSASYRTDIPAFYGHWFRNRLAAGYCLVRNPYGGPSYRVSLRPEDVDGFVFWTKNLGPFWPALTELGRRGCPFVVQYSVTAYPRELEGAVVAAARSVEYLRRLAGDYGPRAGVWRYDPIVTTTLTPADFHRQTFDRLAAALEGAVDEVIISFAQIYRKTRRNLEAAARQAGFGWDDPPDAAKRALAADLAAMAAARGMRLSLCGQRELLGEGVADARCVDAARLSDVAGRALTAGAQGHRPACGCFASRDIGAYDTCPHGCVYCYAVQTPARARAGWRAHDPAGEFL